MSDRRPQKFNNNKGNGSKSIGVGKRIRDIERLFKKRGDSLPAEIKEAKEKELEELRVRFKAKQEKARVGKFSAKYKMVRFLERKRIMKIEAKLNKAIKNLEAKDLLTTEEEEQLAKHREDLKKANNDMTYVMTPMTNERILKLQISIREELMKKKEAGQLEDKDATMELTEELKETTSGENPVKQPNPTTNVSKLSEDHTKPSSNDKAVAKSTTPKLTTKEQKPKGSFQRPEDAAEKVAKKPAKKEKDSFFMGTEVEAEKEAVAPKESKKIIKEDKKKGDDKMQVEPKKATNVKSHKFDDIEDSSSSNDESDIKNQDYVKGGKSSSDTSNSSEDSSSESENLPANKKRKASAADLKNKQKNKKQKK